MTESGEPTESTVAVVGDNVLAGADAPPWATPEVDGWRPAVMRTIDNADAIKAIADPLRVRMLQLLMVSIQRNWSVKEIAAELGQPVTKLYHHVKQLEAAGLIRDVESRIVSGIVEHRYRACQRSMRFDDRLFSGEEPHHFVDHITALIDAVRDDLADYLYREDADTENISVTRTTTRLTPEEIAEVESMVEAMVEKFQANRDAIDRSHLPRTSILFLMNPLGHDPS